MCLCVFLIRDCLSASYIDFSYLEFQFFVVLFAFVQLIGNIALRLVKYFHLTDEVL